MKILFVVNSLSGGGAEKVFIDMLKNLDRSKYEIDVLVVDEWGIYCREVQQLVNYQRIIRHVEQPKIVRWFFGGLSVLLTAMIKYMSPNWLHRTFVTKKYDIEVAYLEGMATKIVAGAENLGGMTYGWVHTDMIKNPWATDQYRSEQEEQECYQELDKVIAVSQAVKEAVEEKFTVKAQVMYNILDDRVIRKQAEEGRRRLLKKASISLISIGSMWRAKGYKRLVRVVHELLKKGYDIQLHLIGDGEEKEKLEAYITEHNLKDKIILYGYEREPYDLLVQGDIYVCSSYAEGFSTTVTEALILGVPVVTTECAGMRELLGESEYGLITENSDGALQKGIEQLVKDEALRDHYREQAIKRGEEFRAAVRIKELEAMFEADIAEKRGDV